MSPDQLYGGLSGLLNDAQGGGQLQRQMALFYGSGMGGGGGPMGSAGGWGAPDPGYSQMASGGLGAGGGGQGNPAANLFARLQQSGGAAPQFSTQGGPQGGGAPGGWNPFGGGGPNAFPGGGATGASQLLAGNAIGSVGRSNGLEQQMPGFLNSANQFLGTVGSSQDALNRIGGSAAGFNVGLPSIGRSGEGFATRLANDVFSPTAQSALYRASVDRAMPDIRSAFTSRGLTTSGPAANAELKYSSDLNLDLTREQRQQQLAAAGLLGGLENQRGATETTGALGAGQLRLGGQQLAGQLAGQSGQLGLAASQVPSRIYGDFMNAQGSALQNILAGQQAQLGPLQALGLQGSIFGQGIDQDLGTRINAGNFLQRPADTLGQMLGGSQLQGEQGYRGLFGINK